MNVTIVQSFTIPMKDFVTKVLPPDFGQMVNGKVSRKPLKSWKGLIREVIVLLHEISALTDEKTGCLESDYGRAPVLMDRAKMRLESGKEIGRQFLQRIVYLCVSWLFSRMSMLHQEEPDRFRS